MNADVKADWVKALRSGDYAKGRGALRKGDEFCCLGVLCDLAVKADAVEPWMYISNEDGASVYGATATLPTPVMRWAGLTDSNPDVVNDDDGTTSLADLNDFGTTFTVLADAIEAQL